MALVYTRSAAAGAGTGADWANAFTTLDAAYTAKAAGDTFFVSADHAQTQASVLTLSCPGTVSNLCKTICVSHTGSVPPVSADLRTTATITTTGANILNINGSGLWRGITFSGGSGATDQGIIIGSNGVNQFAHFKSCKMVKPGTSASAQALKIVQSSGGVAAYIIFDDTTWQVGAANDFISNSTANFYWKNTLSAIAGGTIPTWLIAALNDGKIVLEGVDLSAMGSGKTIFRTNSGLTTSGSMALVNCNLGASVAITSGFDGLGGEVIVVNSDSSGTNYRNEKHNYAGDQTPETTIVRTGGATDGTTPIAVKIVTTAFANWIAPFESLPMPIWNNTTAANVTVSFYGVWGGGAVPNNDDIWIELRYMGSSGSPIATINNGNTKADVLASNAAQSTDASTWGGSTTAFKMSVTLSSPQPALKGNIYAVVRAGAASSTFYYDPEPVLT